MSLHLSWGSFWYSNIQTNTVVSVLGHHATNSNVSATNATAISTTVSTTSTGDGKTLI